jgi:uncharacterized repeat protein (TIGR01451 family)
MRRAPSLLATAGLLAAILLATPPAAAAPAAPAQAPDAGYSGTGTAQLLGVDASLAGQPVVEVQLTRASTEVDSTADPRSTATAANLSGGLLGAVPLDGILSTATQTAPPDNADPLNATLLPVPLDPLLNLDVSSATAWARWPGDGVCLAPGAPISQSQVETANLSVLEIEGLGRLVTVDNPAGGVTSTQSTITTELVDGQAGRALQSESLSQVTSVILFEGTPAEISVDVASTPTLTATATGQPGGATAVLDVPVVNITTPGDSPIPDIPLINLLPLDQLGGVVDQLTDGLEGVLDTVLGEVGILELDILVGEETLAVDAAADGTSVSAIGAAIIIDIAVLSVIGEPLVDARVAVAPLAAAAAVPAGGITCDDGNPLRDLHKDVSQADVKAGSTFDYTLTVPNRGPCDLTDVVVTDVITGPFTSITSDPAATSTEGGTLTWNVGDLAANETATFTVTVTVDPNAPPGTTFTDVLTATGSCEGQDFTETKRLELPRVTDGFNGPCDLGRSNKAASHLEVTPGQTFNYFIHVFNAGGETCEDVDVTDVLDDRLEFVACSDGCSTEGKTVTWSGQTIPAGGGATLTVTVQVADDATGTLANSAQISSPSDPDAPVVRIDGPEITNRSVLAPPNPPSLGPGGPLPTTGGETGLAAIVGLGGLALAALAWRRRLTT